MYLNGRGKAILGIIIALVLVVAGVIWMNNRNHSTNDKAKSANETVAPSSSDEEDLPKSDPNKTTGNEGKDSKNYGTGTAKIDPNSKADSYPSDRLDPLPQVKLSGEANILNQPDSYEGDDQKLYEAAMNVISVRDNRFGPQYDSPKQAMQGLADAGYATDNLANSPEYQEYTPYGRSVHEKALTVQQKNLTCMIKNQQSDVTNGDKKEVSCFNVRNYVTPDGKNLDDGGFQEETGERILLLKAGTINRVDMSFTNDNGEFKIDSVKNRDNS